MGIILLASQSCKSHEVVGRSEVQDVQKFRSVDTVILRDTLYRHDSVIYRERTIHDTVYITKEVYRDTHNSSLIAHNSTQADTVRVVEYRDRVVESPPERYIPPFYKHCTIILFIILAAGVVYMVGKWYIKSRL